ncbi:Ig-like domain-containing protein [Enterobacter hormaechei]|uniref:Ig-like domain-containing protein n=1 Tax=Enterobacter hormaechei TaxID=158836 RepID=UPI00335568DE
MTENKVILAVNNGDGKTRLLTADAGRTVKVKLIPGNKYLLKNVNDDFAPENITLQRVGKALHIIQEGDTQPSIIIENYFDGDSKNPTLMGMAEDGLLYAYIPLSGESYDNGYLMAEGGLAPVALGGEPLGAGGPLLSAPDDENDMLFGMLGWFALAAAGVGAAFALSELEKDESDSQPAPEKPSIGKAVDDEGSIKGPLKSGDVTDDSTPSLIGKGKPGDTIHIIDNDKEIGSVIVDDEGEWSYTPDKPLGDGEHDLSVVVEDPDGNMSPPSDPITIVVDTVAPDAPTIEHIMDKVGKVTGEILEDAYTDDPKPEMSGTGEAGATITIYDNGKKIGETTVNDDGRWYFKPSENLTDGNHSITVSQTDKAGNVSEPSDERDFIVLTEPPGKAETPSVIDDNGPVTGPLKPGDVTDDTKPSFSGEGTPGNTIVIKDNDKEIGSVIVDDEGKWTYTPEKDLSEGEHNVEVIEEDPLGNVGQPSDPIQIIVDTTPPARPDRVDAEDNTGPITGQLKGGDVTDETRPVFSGKGEPGDTVTIYDGDEVLGSTVIDDEGNWSLKPEKPLGEGDHSITVTQTDKAGNTSDPSEALEFEVDTTAPDASADVLKITAVADDVGDRQGNVASGEITDDSKPLISGIGEAGNTVYVYTTDASGKHLIGSAVVGSDGTWSLTPETPLTEGLNQLTLETQDPAGNRVAGDAPSYDINLLIPISTQPSINSVVDNSEPHVGPLQKGDATNDTTPTLSGSAAPGDIVSILDNGKVIGSVTADSNGKWTFTPDAALADGKHTFTVTATDAAGNSRTSGSFPIVIDTAAPSPAENIVINDNVGDKQGPVGSGDTTDDQSPTLSGEAEPGSVVDIYDNDEKIGSVIVDDEGKWSYTPDKPLDKGDHEITTTVTDPSGNTSEPSPGISFTVDPDPNQVTVGEVVDDQGPIVGNLKPGTVTDDVRPELSGKGKPGSTVTIKDGDDVLGSTVVDPDGNWTFTPEQDLADGNHSLTVVSKDPAGNEVTSPSFDITVDATAPEKPVLGSATDDVGTIRGDLSNGSTTDDANPTFNGSAEPGSRVDIYDNGEHIGSTIADDKGAWQFTPTTPLPEGEHHITTTATDEAGNTGPESDDFVLVTDYTPPVATGDVLNITSVMDDVGGRQGNVASGEITDDSKPVINGIGEAGSTVFVYSTDANGKHLLGSAVVNSEGTWTLALDTPLVEGLNQLTLETQDAVGNRVAGEAPSYDITVLIPVSTEPSINSVVDNAEPHVGPMQKGETTNDTTPTLSGSAAPGDVVSILDNGKVIGTVKADSSGKWSFTPDTALADGQHTFTVTATDAAGNARTSGTFPIVIDTAAPSPAENIVINDNVGDKQGPVGDGDTTDDQSPTLSGEAEPGSVVDIYDNDEKIGSVIVDDEGKWSYTPDKPLAKGDHEITTTVTDPSGNTSEPSPGISFTVDPDPNQVTVGEVVDDQGPIVGNLRPGNVTDDARPELGGKGKPGSTVTIMDGDDVLGSTVVDPDGNWTFTPEQDLADGDHSLTVISKDPAGNDVTSPSFDISVDTVAPEKPVVGLATDDVGSSRGDLSSGSTTDDANPTFKGSAEPGSRVDIYDNGELIGSTVVDENGGWQFTPTTALPEGEHHITTTATDKAGNTGPESDDFVLITDYTAPDASKVAITEVYDDVNTAGVIASGEETDDNRPLIKGTGAEPGNTITVYNGDKVIGTAKVQADGTWSLEPTTPLPDGRYTLTAKETDGVGNVSGPSAEYVINVATVPPQAPTLDTIVRVMDDKGSVTGEMKANDVTDDARPEIIGKAKAGSTVTIMDGNVVLGSVKADASGNWVFTPTSDLGDGVHNITATAKDLTGKEDTSSTFSFEIDSKAPNRPSIDYAEDQVGTVKDDLNSNDVTDDPQPILHGTAEAGSTVNIYTVDGTLLGSVTANSNGAWNFKPGSKLPEGKNTFYVTATDEAGNVSDKSADFILTTDYTAPDASKVTIDSVTDNVGNVQGIVADGGVLDDSRPVIRGSGAEVGNVITVYTTDKDGNTKVLGTTTVDQNGKWELTPSESLYGDSINQLTVTETDRVGNVAKPADSYDVIMSDTPDAPAILNVLDDTGTTVINLANNALTKDDTPTLKGTADGAAGDTITIYNGSQVVGKTTLNSDGTWSFTPSPALADGSYTFTVTNTNSAGQESDRSGSFTVTIDSTAPNPVSGLQVSDDQGAWKGQLTDGMTTDDNKPTFTGKAEQGSTVTIYDNGQAMGTVTVTNPDGSWQFTPSTPLVDGEHQFATQVTDPAGNASAIVDDITVNVSTGASYLQLLQVVDDVQEAGGSRVLRDGEVTNDSQVQLVGKATAGSTIIITDVGGVQLGTVKADANGNWEFTPTSSLSDGAHTLRITGTDPSNNPLTPIDFDLVVDTVAPVAPAITDVLDDVNPVQGSVAHGKPTNDTTPEITGTAEKGSTVNVYHQVDATTRILLGTAVADSTTGQWTLQITDANKLAEGTWNLVATSTDAAGNVSTPSNTWTIVVDTTVSDAVINISSVSEDRGASDTDFITSDNTLLINGELNKALQADEWVEISLDNGVTWTRASTVTGTSWTVDMQSTPLNDGAYTIQARVVDNAGNVGSTDSQALQVASGGSDMNGLSTTTKVTTDTSHGLTTGDHFSHAATATNGDMVTRDRTVTISGNLSAALQAGEHLQISLDNGKTWKTLALNGQSWSYELPEATASTTHSFKLQVIDVAGNPGTNTNFADSYNVVIDLDSPNGITGAPDVPQHTTTGDSFTFSSGQYGRVEAGAIISLVSDVNNNGTYQEGLDQVIGFVKANADGSWSLNTSLPSGAHNLAFVVWDEAGNRSSMSASTSTGVTEGGGSTLIEQTWGGTTDADSRGLNAAAVTISQDGLWSFFQSARGTSGTATANAGRVYDSVTREDYDSTYLAQPSTENGAGYDVDSTSYSRYVNSAAFADINRDGYADVMSQISSYSNAGRTAYWLQNADGSYSAKALDQGTLNHLGGVISYDREGDGYLDFVLGDSEADSISFIKNTQGTLSYEDNSGFSDGHPGGALPTSLSVLHEVGAVDIDNNGTVDITAHIDYNGAGNLVGNNSRGLGILYNQTTGTSKTNFGEVGYYANVFRDDGHEDYGNLSISMTYADYNNDGWLDLFLSRGSKGGSNSDESRIYLNDGTGKLNATDSQAQWFGDNVDGGTSLAVDWNHDGKMDIIEVPRSGVTGSPMLYTNTGSNNWGANKVSLTGSTTFNNMTGAVALDYDWDGSMDLVLYRSGADADVVARDDAGRTMLVKNTNIAADGTSLQIRIVDGNGINTFYSNTVKLYNSAGELVATQLINPQSSGSSNSMGLVSFFGLDPNEVYSVQMLRITDGEADHVGATSSIGGYTNGTVNESWGGLTTGKAHDSYVLTAESGNAANNTSGNSGIVGTGYNDTFFGSAGNDTYNGGGGWNQIVSGKPVWSETAGMDVVDYSRSTTAINANLWTGTATGNGTDKLLNIEGLLGSSQQDTFTDNSANNLFDGRGGNDAFYLVNGGNDTLMYNVLEGMTNDSTGGNGHDTIHGFKVGNLVKDSDADLLDMSELLDYKGSISFFEDDGKLELDYSSRGVLDYVKVEVVGSDTVISIDRDGQGGQHGFTQVVTLADVQTDLVTLLQNNQIMM